ncbi:MULTISPECIES: hypothetical protein [Streptomyces]|uniref:Uncharacterized protein n=1 Tax=Streptomyces flaveolus TaxID=67297 RepID=A0ABV3AR26_9ACTN|nr:MULTISPECIES: hypothetical protein [Streptomyces]KMS78297.1 hypothetical protein ACZ91_63570 [Streptomyces regensis]KOV71816.1 hypothetical protein ADL02_45215 [Streptomyces sp. NRRL WC-3723]MBG7696553.1 hypothetical protein [Streptomyces sp. MC1]
MPVALLFRAVMHMSLLRLRSMNDGPFLGQVVGVGLCSEAADEIAQRLREIVDDYTDDVFGCGVG